MKARLALVPFCALLHLSCGMVDPDPNQPGSFLVVHGGAGDDEGWSVIQTSDGGYLLFGTTSSFGNGNRDFYLVKTDPSGVEQWARTYGGTEHDEGRSVRESSDGGYIMAGTTASPPIEGSTDILLVKTDLHGDTLWTRRFGGSGAETVTAVENAPGGGYIVCGSTKSFGSGSDDFWIIRTDPSGTRIWDRTFGGTAAEVCNDVVATPDGGFLAVGVVNPNLNSVQVNVGKADASGGKVFDLRNLVGTSSSAYDAVAVREGGYMTIGHSIRTLPGAIDSLHFTRLDSTGQRRLSTWGIAGGRSFGRRGGNRGYSLVQTRDGGFAALGYTRAFSEGRADFYLVKINEAGALLWESTFGGDGEDIGQSIAETADGGFIMLGTTKSFITGENGTDMMLVKVGPEGKLAP